jgi:hypothetical protein
MRDKYVLRSGKVGEDPDAWVLAIYFTRLKENPKEGIITIGGPKRFAESMDEVLMRHFDLQGTEDEMVTQRQQDKKRKRIVYDVGPIPFEVFRKGVRYMIRTGISVVRVRAMGRLLR